MNVRSLCSARHGASVTRAMLESRPMSVEAPPSAYASRREPIVREDYELDLRALFAVVLRQLPLVLACLVLAVGAAGVYVYLQPRSYDGVSKVIISRPKQQVTLEPKLVTNTSDFELRPFYTHAKHPDVERAVQDKLRAQLSDSELQPGGLVERLQTKSAKDDTALMELHFANPDGHKAALVANAWADAYLAHAREQLNPSAQAQQLVEVPLRDSLAELQRREDAVRQFQQRTGLGIAPSTDNVRIDVGAAAIPGASNVQTATIPVSMRSGARGRELSAKTGQVTDLRAQRDQVRLALAQARALRAANVPLDSLGADLEKLGVARGTAPEAAAAALEARERALGEAADRANAELRALETSLSEELGQLERLERERDVARDSYVALAKKAEENKIALAAEWPVVRQFARSPDPAGVEPRPWLSALGPAAAAGLVVGVGGAFWLDRRRLPRSAPSVDGGLRGRPDVRDRARADGEGARRGSPVPLGDGQ
jgi:uncharacterized protein involved in exopolysaccharide biosynthesis